MKSYHIIYIFLVSTFTFSQEGIDSNYDPNYLTENMPKSPEASNLGQYGDIKNNSYNGKANISIPIHVIDFEGLQIPIQLNYDTGGVRVASEASWVGLNWSLTPHVGIHRTVNANDDLRRDLIPDATGSPTAFPFNNDLAVQQPSPGGVPYVTLDDVFAVHESIGGGVNFHSPTNYADLQPDILEASIFGNTYKFRFKKRIGESNILETHIFNKMNV